MSVSASFIVVAVIIIRAICIHKLPKRAFVVIWGIAVARLLIPISITSRFSILSIFNSLWATMQGDNIYQGQEMLSDTIGIATVPYAYGGITAPAMLYSAVMEGDIAAGTSEFGGAFPFFEIWLAVACCFALYFLITHFRCCNVYRTAMPIEDNMFVSKWIMTYPLKRRLRIKQSDRIDTPLTYGVLRPIILLPSHVVSDGSALPHILKHEYIHVCRFDTLLKWILATALALHWFNPLVWVLYILANRDIELSCDEAVVRLLGEHKKTEYAMTLLGLAEKRNGLLTLSSNFSKNAIEERIVSIMKRRKYSHITMIAVVIAISCVTLGFATSGDIADNMRHEGIAETSSRVSFFPGADEQLPGKVAVVTLELAPDTEMYGFVRGLSAQFGSDNIVHRTWPNNFMQETEMMIDVLQEIAADPEVRILIIKHAVINTNAAVRMFREVRDDVFIIYNLPSEDHGETVMLADLVFGTNDILSAESIVLQAKSMGAETIVHYSFPRHMMIPALAERRDVMMTTAQREGLQFVEIEAPDPMEIYDSAVLQMFLENDISGRVEDIGANTAFFGTACAMQTYLISSVVDSGALFPQLCCPSPFHGFPAALGIADRIYAGEGGENNEGVTRTREAFNVIADIRDVLDARDAGGRLSTWAVSADSMWGTIGMAYAIEWLNGNVPQEHGVIDLDVLSRLAQYHAENSVGEQLGASFEFFEHNGHTYNNFVLMTVDFITF